MNIAIFTDSYDHDDNIVSKSAKALYDTLMDHGHNVYVVCPSPDDQEARKDGNMIYLPAIKAFSTRRLATIYSYKAYTLIKNLKLDIIHIEQGLSISSFGRICAQVLHVPVIYTVHMKLEDYVDDFTNSKNANSTRNFCEMLLRKIIQNNGEVITHDVSMRKYLKELSPSTFINCYPDVISDEKTDTGKYYESTMYVYEKAIRKNY